MAAEFSTGNVVKVSKSSCVVALCVTKQQFSINKTIFYTYGLKCDGDMRNVIEEGMEVELYLRAVPNNPPRILAVWLGDRPEVFEEEDPLKPVYDQQGFFSELVFGGFFIVSDYGKVFVKQENFYRDGNRSTLVTSTEDSIMFDAVPLKDAVSCWYVATCAWVGRKPRLIERLCPRLEDTSSTLLGTVGVVVSDVMAIADVHLNSEFIKVILFRSSFNVAGDRIQDIVDVGDRLRIRISDGCLSRRRKLWFAEMAEKMTDVIFEDESCESETGYVENGGTVNFEDESRESETGVGNGGTVNSEDESRESESGYVENGGTIENGNVEPAVESERISAEIVRREIDAEGTDTGSEITSNVESEVDCDSVLSVALRYNGILYSSPPLQGVIKRYNGNAFISYGDFKIFVPKSNFYVNGQQTDDFDCDLFDSGNNLVKFDAVPMNRKGREYSAFSHEATKAWVGKKPTLKDMVADLYPPHYELTKKKKWIFRGCVRKLFLPKSALVVITHVPTTVHIHGGSFVTEPYYDTTKLESGRNFITNFLRLGDVVEFQLKKIYRPPWLESCKASLKHVFR